MDCRYTCGGWSKTGAGSLPKAYPEETSELIMKVIDTAQNAAITLDQMPF